MNNENVIRTLTMLGARNIQDRGDWVTSSCVFASKTHGKGKDYHPSFGISVGEVSSYHCFACGRKGRVLSLPTVLTSMGIEHPKELKPHINRSEVLFMVGGKYEAIKKKEVKPIDARVFQQFRRLTTPVGPISMESIDKWSLRFDDKEYRMIIPIFNKDKQLVAIRGRYMGQNESTLRYRTYSEYTVEADPKSGGVWFGEQFPINKNKPVILVEGERDAILLYQIGVGNVMAGMGASISGRQVERIREWKAKTIVLFFDADRAGWDAAKKIGKELKGHCVVKIVKDYADCKDPAEIVEKGKAGLVLKSSNISVFI